MEQLNGLYFFLMSEGAYSDYGVNALYVSDKPVTEEDWHKFAEEESKVREDKRKEIITDNNYPYCYEEQRKQWLIFDEWRTERGSIEAMFAKAYNLTKVDYQELWFNH